jgi:arginase
LCAALAEKIRLIVEAGYFPFVLGGDCSLLMGVIEGFRRSNVKVGMVYMDAHGDFNTPETTPSGIIGGMDVAIVTGRGPKRLVDMFGHSPLLPEENIVLYGVRDLDPLEAEALAESKAKVFTREKVRKEGAENSAAEVLRYLLPRCDCLYLHVDLDVIDASVFSAAGLPVADGLSKEEFQATVQGLVRSGRICGVMLAAFDAAKDADGTQAKKLVDLVVSALYGR